MSHCLQFVSKLTVDSTLIPLLRQESGRFDLSRVSAIGLTRRVVPYFALDSIISAASMGSRAEEWKPLRLGLLVEAHQFDFFYCVVDVAEAGFVEVAFLFVGKDVAFGHEVVQVDHEWFF